jgi:uncharacterized protein with gpF-like domain
MALLAEIVQAKATRAQSTATSLAWAARLLARQFERERQVVRRLTARALAPIAVELAAEHAIRAEAQHWARVFAEIAVTLGEPAARATFARLRSRRGRRSKTDEIDWSALLAELGPVEDRWTADVLAWVRATAGAKISAVADTTLDDIRAAIAEGVELGESIQKIAKRIDALYLEEIVPHRSVVIARTETVAASNMGARAGALATELPLEHEWMTTNDARTRRSHAVADGQRRAIAEPFIVNGYHLLFPGDGSLGAPARELIACRCSVGYHVAGER